MATPPIPRHPHPEFDLSRAGGVPTTTTAPLALRKEGLHLLNSDNRLGKGDKLGVFAVVDLGKRHYDGVLVERAVEQQRQHQPDKDTSVRLDLDR